MAPFDKNEYFWCESDFRTPPKEDKEKAAFEAANPKLRAFCPCMTNDFLLCDIRGKMQTRHVLCGLCGEYGEGNSPEFLAKVKELGIPYPLEYVEED